MFVPILVFLLCWFVPYADADVALVEDFALMDQTGRSCRLYEERDRKAIVIISYAIGCPIAAQYLPVLEDMKRTFAQDVTFFLIDPADERNDLEKEVRNFGLTVPILEDPQGIISRTLEFSRTAQALVIDPHSWKIVYSGSTTFLKDALTAFLNGNPIPVPEKANAAQGCLLFYPPTSALTYVRDIAPVLKKNCVVCHSPGGVAPWSMNSYEKINKWGPMIREVVRTQRMPPWHADPHYGKFKNDISLSPAEKNKIVRWVESGMTRGEGRDPLVGRKSNARQEWDLGQPDVIYYLKDKQEIAAASSAGPDVFINVEADRPVDEDMWVTAFEIKPGNVRLVHHANITVETMSGDVSMAVMPSEQQKKWLKDSGLSSMEGGQVIAGYSPGMGGVPLPKDTGIFIPKGSRLMFRMHYVTTGKQQEDLSKVGFYFQKRQPKKILSVATMHNREIMIPAGEKDYPRQAEYTFKQNVLLTMLQPHMHYRGKAMRFTAVYPDGTSEILLSVPNYKFTWQRQYVFVTPKKIPAGTKIILDGSYDNSLANPFNREPLREVVYGPGSDQEMFTGIMFYIKE